MSLLNPQSEMPAMLHRLRWTALSLVILPSTLVAQDTPRKLFGPVLGMNRSTVGGSAGTSAGYTEKSGIAFGLQLQRAERNNQTFFRGSIMYSDRGGRQDGGGGSELRLSMRYLEVPVLLGWNLLTQSSVTPHLLGGGQASVKLYCQVQGISSGSPPQKEKCSNVGFRTSVLDLAFVYGGGITFPVPRGTATFSALYNNGKRTIDATSSPGEMLNRGWGFTFGYVRPLWRR